MPYTDPIVLGLLLLSLIGSLLYQWRRGLRGGRLAVVTFAMFYGLAMISALGMHCIDLLYGWSHGLTSFRTGKPFGWDWHLYSLMLFGALLIWFGAQCLRHALRMGRGEAYARVEFLRLAGVTLLIVAPTIPIQALFGVVASALSVIALLVVGLGARTRPAGSDPTRADPSREEAPGMTASMSGFGTAVEAAPTSALHASAERKTDVPQVERERAR